jgi:membrane protein implicated in regulation of membrane protease activity
VLFGFAAGGAGLAKQVITRPELGVVGSSTHNSFPSGHAAVATALLLSALLVVPGRARVWVAVPGATGVSGIAAATMIAGWHRFSDVVGSLLLVATLYFVAAAALARWTAKPTPNGQPPPHAGGVALATGGTLLMVPLLAVAPDAGVPLVAAIAATNALTMVVVWAAVRLGQPGATAPEPEDTKTPRAYVHPGRL